MLLNILVLFVDFLTLLVVVIPVASLLLLFSLFLFVFSLVLLFPLILVLFPLIIHKLFFAILLTIDINIGVSFTLSLSFLVLDVLLSFVVVDLSHLLVGDFLCALFV